MLSVYGGFSRSIGTDYTFSKNLQSFASNLLTTSLQLPALLPQRLYSQHNLPKLGREASSPPLRLQPLPFHTTSFMELLLIEIGPDPVPGNKPVQLPHFDAQISSLPRVHVDRPSRSCVEMYWKFGQNSLPWQGRNLCALIILREHQITNAAVFVFKDRFIGVRVLLAGLGPCVRLVKIVQRTAALFFGGDGDGLDTLQGGIRIIFISL